RRWWIHRRRSGHGGRAVQPVEPQSGDGEVELSRIRRHEGPSARHHARQLLRRDEMRKSFAIALMLSASVSGVAFADQELPHHLIPSSKEGNLVIGLCDGETSVEVPGVKPGEDMTREQAQWAADTLMAEWRAKHPDADWVVAAAEAEGIMKPVQL